VGASGVIKDRLARFLDAFLRLFAFRFLAPAFR
jgi:hypothetical protein